MRQAHAMLYALAIGEDLLQAPIRKQATGWRDAQKRILSYLQYCRFSHAHTVRETSAPPQTNGGMSNTKLPSRGVSVTLLAVLCVQLPST